MIFGIISRKLLCPFKSWLLTKRYVDTGNGRIVIKGDPFLKVRIHKPNNALFELHGILKIQPYLGGNAPVNIILSSNSRFVINGNFDIGHGVTIFLASASKLLICGGGGITCDSRIMVKEQIELGKDFICSWNCTITDCDWHTIVGHKACKPICIGDPCVDCQ